MYRLQSKGSIYTELSEIDIPHVADSIPEWMKLLNNRDLYSFVSVMQLAQIT